VAGGDGQGGVLLEGPRTIQQWDLEEDVIEAQRQGKHVIVFFHLDECPYCARMLNENFREGESRKFMEQRFDVVAVNVMGDLSVDWIDGETYTEKGLKKHLKAIATPTIVFLDFDGNKVLQLNGYRDPVAYRHALEYVDTRQYAEKSFADYVDANSNEEVYQLRSHPSFERITYFKNLKKPLAVIFEDETCAECDRFHKNTLNHPDVLEALKLFHVVRLDAESDQKLVDPQGQVTTIKEWVKELNVTFRPGLVLFNGGEELFRADGLLYHHHLTEALRYVAEGHLKYPTLDEFKTAYRDELIRSGKGVDFSE
jgi:thioredoxin-related protein